MTPPKPPRHVAPHTAATVKHSLGAQSTLRRNVGKLLRYMMDNPEGVFMEELVQAAGMSESTTRAWVNAFRAEQVVRVCAYPPDELGRRNTVMQYALNPDRKNDARKSAPLTNSEKTRNYRERQKARHTIRSNALMNGSWLRNGANGTAEEDLK